MKRSTKALLWAERVAEWKKSGQTADSFCKGKDFRVAALKWWSSKLAKAAKEKGVPPKVLPSPRMARVVRTIAPRSSCSKLVVRIGQAEISLVAGFDRALLSEVVTVLSGAAK